MLTLMNSRSVIMKLTNTISMPTTSISKATATTSPCWNSKSQSRSQTTSSPSAWAQNPSRTSWWKVLPSHWWVGGAGCAMEGWSPTSCRRSRFPMWTAPNAKAVIKFHAICSVLGSRPPARTRVKETAEDLTSPDWTQTRGSWRALSAGVTSVLKTGSTASTHECPSTSTGSQTRLESEQVLLYDETRCSYLNTHKSLFLNISVQKHESVYSKNWFHHLSKIKNVLIILKVWERINSSVWDTALVSTQLKKTLKRSKVHKWWHHGEISSSFSCKVISVHEAVD